jgi:hypothetical protein
VPVTLWCIYAALHASGVTRSPEFPNPVLHGTTDIDSQSHGLNLFLQKPVVSSSPVNAFLCKANTSITAYSHSNYTRGRRVAAVHVLSTACLYITVKQGMGLRM